MPAETPTVWHIGSEDVHLRIPLLRALRARGFAVGAVGSETGERFEGSGIPYWRYPLARWIAPVTDLRSKARLRALLAEHRPDIVHAFDLKPGLLATGAAYDLGIPVRIRTITGMGYVFAADTPLARALRPTYRHLQRRADKTAHLTVFQNPDDRAYFLAHGMTRPGRDALVLGSGIDVEAFVAAVPDGASLHALRRELGLEGKRVVTLVARLIKHKGIYEFLEAAALVRERRPDTAFLLAGPIASEGAQAVSLAAVHGQAAVRYLGPRRDVAALLAISDLFTLPSYYREGVPRVLLEAGALGLPLITTDMPGCREVVRHRYNGLLIPPRNAHALAAAIEALLDADTLRQAMGARSRVHVKNTFSLAQVADAYAAIYRRVLAETAARADFQRRRFPCNELHHQV